MSSIWDWLYRRRRELIFLAAIFLVSTLSFGLGYLANREYSRAPIVIEKCPSSTDP
ncbi:MAG: hypothetical protein HY978_00840 [Candidatus Liptonbacteria bacterium]|nr:hypothetical protein [Candidatus Liptonbacteria bacterium]